MKNGKLGKMFWGGGEPVVDFEDGEKIEVEVRRAKAGLILIWAAEVVGFVLLTVALVVLASMGKGSVLPLNETAMGYLYLIIVMMYIVLVMSGWIGTKVYKANFLTVTNKRVIQRTTTSLFARSVNVIELKSVEDVSFSENNIMDRLLGMGTVRMATVGDETTYTLTFVSAKDSGVRKIAKLVHAAKEGKNDESKKEKKKDDEGVIWERKNKN